MLAQELELPEGRDLVRAAVYQLLEDDARPDCLALLRCHDADKSKVDDTVASIVNAEAGEFRLDDPEARKVRTPREHIIRDRTLRLAVRPAYDFACALCATRIVWNNLSGVEAAHIKPRSPRGVIIRENALSLCQTHHWAFDLGLWSADDDLDVVVGAPVEPRGDDLAALRGFAGGNCVLPTRASTRPHPEALRWHRVHRFGRAE